MTRQERILLLFPQLTENTFQITSPPATRYNCVAWVAGETSHWWWPIGEHPELYWPEKAPREETLEAFKATFAALGYAECPGDELEFGVEKVAIFADVNAVPTHAARQLPSGTWTSKLGKAEDIEHALRDLEGDVYGTVAVILKRPRPML